MNTSEILNKTLAWLYIKEQEVPGTMWDITGYLDSIGEQHQSEAIGLELAERGYLRTYYRYESQNIFNAAINTIGIQQVAPEEVFTLTQIVLNTLNCEPQRFHDISDLPGLEAKAWLQLVEFTRYLLKQNWIEAKVLNDKLLVKLTIEGRLYLKSYEFIA
ncbi:hypothetical protein AAE02nite_25130 [Adhaeribacter aerolatus]|uniref:Uncharacterized protein n=1 Tax=Adhaeribacter aerolatus TaxID=670289 RepID=A0A512AYQ5_9BACT|nr:hypothetical protein [Adhaeribacter aerolatus]GEO04849.1 hypothetical protein AAE02nite_25130 [Adhaeribacter aerolatus]